MRARREPLAAQDGLGGRRWRRRRRRRRGRPSSARRDGVGAEARGERARGLRAGAPHTRISAHSRSRSSARRCASPCTPVPSTASTSASARASRRVASREPAAVRAAVIASPSISAAGVPVAASKTTIAAWWAGSWPGKTETSLTVTDGCSWRWAPISRIEPAPGTSTPARGGIEARPALRAAKAAASSSTRASGSSAASTSARDEDAQPHEPGAPRVRQPEALRERVVGVEHELVRAGDPGAARDRGDDRLDVADPRAARRCARRSGCRSRSR